MEEGSFIKSLSPNEHVAVREWGLLYKQTNLPPPKDLPIGTVVMPTGDWLDRLRPSLSFFEEKFDEREEKPSLVITGANSFDITHKGASAKKIVSKLKTLSIPEETKKHIFAEENATNTKEQAENVYAMLQEGKIKGPLVLVVSAYHLPRIYSTFIKTVLEHEKENLETKIYAIPIYKDWKGQIPFEDKIRRNQIVPEIERVRSYRANNDVATNEELSRYLEWLQNGVSIYKNGNDIGEGLKRQIVKGYHAYFPPNIWEGKDPNDWFEKFNEDVVQPARFVRLDNDKIVSHAAVISRTVDHAGERLKLAGLGGVFTDEHHRGKNLGKQIVESATRYIDNEGYDLSVLFCMPHLKKFYERLGWEVVPNENVLVENKGEKNTVAKDEIVMARYVSKKAKLDKLTIDNPLFVGEEW